MVTLFKIIFVLTCYNKLGIDPKNFSKESPETLSPLRKENTSPLAQVLFTGFSFPCNSSLAWYFRGYWVHLEAHKVIMPIKRIKITPPLALILIWMSCIHECNPDLEMVEARKNKKYWWERKAWIRTIVVTLLQKFLRGHLNDCQNIHDLPLGPHYPSSCSYLRLFLWTAATDRGGQELSTYFCAWMPLEKFLRVLFLNV